MNLKTEYWKSLLVSSCFLISCGTCPEVFRQSFEPDVPTYRLAVVDSFGEEMGDSLTLIGSIDGFCCHPSGAVLVLDRVMGRVRVVQEDGSASFFGQHGQGPSEFRSPRGICAMQDGRILVSEPSRQLVMEFDERGGYIGRFFETHEGGAPDEIFQVDSNSIVGGGYTIDYDGGQPSSFRYYIGRFDASSEPSVEYFDVSTDFSSAQFYKDMELFDFIADPAGRVYVVPDNTEYRINVLTSDGTAQYEIAPESDRIEKSEEEIDSEIQEFEDSGSYFDNYRGGFQPSHFYPLISLAGVDSAGNLWVQRLDSEGEYLFDLWDSTGCLQRNAVLEKPTTDLEITVHVDRHGIVGANIEPPRDCRRPH